MPPLLLLHVVQRLPNCRHHHHPSWPSPPIMAISSPSWPPRPTSEAEGRASPENWTPFPNCKKFSNFSIFSFFQFFKRFRFFNFLSKHVRDVKKLTFDGKIFFRFLEKEVSSPDSLGLRPRSLDEVTMTGSRWPWRGRDGHDGLRRNHGIYVKRNPCI